MLKTLAASLLALALGSGAAVADTWTRLGTVTFTDPFTTTNISMPKGVGAMSALRFSVTGSDVEIADLKVTYGNGQVDDIPVRAVFRAGSSTRVIPLPGYNGRYIDKVTVTYRAHGQARFDILGNAVPQPTPSWQSLGCQSVGFAVDHDAINVGLQDGGFTAIRLRVQNAPVEFRDATVVFGNGQTQKLPVRSIVPAGSMSRQLDLAGQVRGIRRIDFLYRSIPSYHGQAKVCADGLSTN